MGFIVMKINNVGYLLKEGIRGIFLHGFMSFAAICVTVACLLIVGTFSSLIYNLNIMVEELNMTNEVVAYVDDNLSDAEARSVGTQINRIGNVMESTFVDRQTALEDFIADHDGDDSFSGVTAEDLRHRVVVVLEDNSAMKTTVDRISQIRQVVSVPLVLHGTSGVPDDTVRECIARGMCKVNYATDLRIAFSNGVKDYLAANPDVYDPKKYCAKGRELVKQYVMDKILVCGSNGRA